MGEQAVLHPPSEGGIPVPGILGRGDDGGFGGALRGPLDGIFTYYYDPVDRQAFPSPPLFQEREFKILCVSSKYY